MQLLPLLLISALLYFIFCIKSSLFKSTSITLKNSLQADFPLINSIFSSLDILRTAPLQLSMSEMFVGSSSCSIKNLASWKPGISSWRRIKLCCMQVEYSATNTCKYDLRSMWLCILSFLSFCNYKVSRIICFIPIQASRP